MSFGQLGIERKHFFARAAAGKIGLIGLSGLHLRLSTGGLAAQVGVVELQQELAFSDAVAFFHQQPLDCCRDGRVGLEVLYGLNFSVCRNKAADRAALDRGGADSERTLAGENWD